MLEPTTAEILLEARDLLAEDGSWCQGQSARDSEGNRVMPEDASAVSFCAVGALVRVLHSHNALSNCIYANQHPACRFLNRAAERLGYTQDRMGLVPAAAFNDTVARTQSQVVGLLDDAARLAKESDV